MKKGFTLIEMIGVMVILSLLLLFVMPSVINYIKKGGDTKDTVVKTMIFEATKKYINDNKNVFIKDTKNTYCVSVNELASEGYIDSPMTLSSSDDDITSEESTKTVKITYDKKYKCELTDECIGIVNPTPILYKGLTPVMYVDESTAENPTAGYWKVPEEGEEWYNYNEQKWANAVVLGKGKTKNPGEVVTVEETLDENENPVAPDALMMLVWIPRYEYKYTNLGFDEEDNQQFGKDGISIEQPGEIEVNFISKVMTEPTTNEYKIHPAFTFGTQELSGIWVGKFELSHTTKSLGNGASSEDSTAANLNCINENCSEAEYLRILPNVSSLRYNNISNFFYAIRSVEKNYNTFGLVADTHMIKNSEWGAVAYLSQSRYGKYGNTDYEGIYREIYENNYNINTYRRYITGLSVGVPYYAYNHPYIGQCLYNDMTDLGRGKGQCGPGASTTGNVYGVYDMNGGSWEYVMAVHKDANNNYASQSGFNGINFRLFSYTPYEETSGIPFPSSKYYDKFILDDDINGIIQLCKKNDCGGQALLETLEWYNDKIDYMIDLTSSDTYRHGVFSWFSRGGNGSTNNSYGIYGLYPQSGGGSFTQATRLVLTKK